MAQSFLGFHGTIDGMEALTIGWHNHGIAQWDGTTEWDGMAPCDGMAQRDGMGWHDGMG